MTVGGRRSRFHRPSGYTSSYYRYSARSGTGSTTGYTPGYTPSSYSHGTTGTSTYHPDYTTSSYRPSTGTYTSSLAPSTAATTAATVAAHRDRLQEITAAVASDTPEPITRPTSRLAGSARTSGSDLIAEQALHEAEHEHGHQFDQSLQHHDHLHSEAGSARSYKHRFEIIKKLGSGTYGKVSLAFDHKFNREVAVKLIKKSAIENKQDLIRIKREIRIMSALKHPNIVEIYEVFENREKIIIVLEYASGGELYDYVSNKGCLDEPESRTIFRQIVSAVLYCHRNKVAHRDLKLENILLDKNMTAKIADFGLSNYFGSGSLLNTFCGSPLYASPEIINGIPYKGPEVDCWSLGVLLYTLVYGSMPFDGRDFNRMVRQIKRGAYYEPEQPSTASILIRSMLRVNPERRAPIAEIASHWWLNAGDENQIALADLPENEIDETQPALTERGDTLIVQDLHNETDVFLEFGHLSSATRRKIEEYRRRRKEAEQSLEAMSHPSAQKKDKKDAQAMMLDDLDDAEIYKSEKKPRKKDKKAEPPAEPTITTTSAEPTVTAWDDPLSRLRALETRLGGDSSSAAGGSKRDSPRPPSRNVEEPVRQQPESRHREPSAEPQAAREKSKSRSPSPPALGTREVGRPLVVSPAAHDRPSREVEVDTLNMLMDQVINESERGRVRPELILRIRNHPKFETNPFVKEVLDGILGALKEVHGEAPVIEANTVGPSSSRLPSPPRSPRVHTTGTTAKNAQAAAAPTICAGGTAAASLQPRPRSPSPPPPQPTRADTDEQTKRKVEPMDWRSARQTTAAAAATIVAAPCTGNSDESEEETSSSAEAQQMQQTQHPDPKQVDQKIEEDKNEIENVELDDRTVEQKGHDLDEPLRSWRAVSIEVSTGGVGGGGTISRASSCSDVEIVETCTVDFTSDFEDFDDDDDEDEDMDAADTSKKERKLSSRLGHESDNESFVSAASEKSKHTSHSDVPPDPTNADKPPLPQTILTRRFSKGKYERGPLGILGKAAKSLDNERTEDETNNLYERAKAHVVSVPSTPPPAPTETQSTAAPTSAALAKLHWLRSADPDMGHSFDAEAPEEAAAPPTPRATQRVAATVRTPEPPTPMPPAHLLRNSNDNLNRPTTATGSQQNWSVVSSTTFDDTSSASCVPKPFPHKAEKEETPPRGSMFHRGATGGTVLCLAGTQHARKQSADADDTQLPPTPAALATPTTPTPQDNELDMQPEHRSRSSSVCGSQPATRHALHQLDDQVESRRSVSVPRKASPPPFPSSAKTTEIIAKIIKERPSVADDYALLLRHHHNAANGGAMSPTFQVDDEGPRPPSPSNTSRERPEFIYAPLTDDKNSRKKKGRSTEILSEPDKDYDATIGVLTSPRSSKSRTPPELQQQQLAVAPSDGYSDVDGSAGHNEECLAQSEEVTVSAALDDAEDVCVSPTEIGHPADEHLQRENLGPQPTDPRRASYRNAIDLCSVPVDSVPKDAAENAHDGSGGRDPFYQYTMGHEQSPSLFNYVRPRFNARTTYFDYSQKGPVSRMLAEDDRKSRSLHELSPEGVGLVPNERAVDTPSPGPLASPHRYDASSRPRSTSRHRSASRDTSDRPAAAIAPQDTGPHHYAHETTSTRLFSPEPSGTYQSYAARQRPASTGGYSAQRDWYSHGDRAGSPATRDARPQSFNANEHTAGYYRSKFDGNNVSYRRGYYDVLNEEPSTSGAGATGPSHSTRGSSGVGGARRAILHAWNRTGAGDSHEDVTAGHHRYGTPVDTEAAAVSGGPTRSILKKTEHETSPSRLKSWLEGSGNRFRPSRFVDKLRRHRSNEKLHRVNEDEPHDDYRSRPNSRYGYTSSGYDNTGSGSTTEKEASIDSGVGESSAAKAGRKKKSILDMARRRTTAITTANVRPTHAAPIHTDVNGRRSPLDKIKGLFRKSKENLSSPSSNDTHAHTSAASSYTPSYGGGAAHRAGAGGTTASRYSAAGYSPRTSHYGSRPHSTYSPSTTGAAGTGAGSSWNRRWYDDHPLY